MNNVFQYDQDDRKKIHTVHCVNENITQIAPFFGKTIFETEQAMNDPTSEIRRCQFQKKIKHLKKNEVYLPLFIKQFDILIKHLQRCYNNLQSSKNESKLYKFILHGILRKKTNDGLSEALKIIGAKNKRSELKRLFEIKTPLDWKNVDEQIFIEKFLIPYFFELLNNICRFYAYKHIKLNNNSVAEIYNQYNLDSYQIDSMYFFTGTSLKAIFDIEIIVPQLFIDKSDSLNSESVKFKESPLYEFSKYCKIPEKINQKILKTPKNIIYDFYSVGLKSKTINIDPKFITR